VSPQQRSEDHVLKRFFAWLKPFFVLAPVQGLRPDPSSGEGRYVRSFLVMRLIIGGLGVLLPFLLVFADRWWFGGDPFPRGSMSIYYYSGMREFFTVAIGTIAFFLLAYKITEKNLDNILSFFAGLAGMLIPIFPTGPPSLTPKPPHPLPPPPTPLQDALHETTKAIHFSASGVFIVLLGLMAIMFGIREGQRTNRNDDPHFGPGFWRAFHFTCAFAILAACVWIVFTVVIFDGPYWSLLVGEGVSAAAFGASWLAKGAEWRYLLGQGTGAQKLTWAAASA
jgi:hypothetical protein